MSRPYLRKDEVEFALTRAKVVECFVGPCERDGKHGVRYLELSLSGDDVVLRVYETQDVGSSDFLDLYEFGPLNPDVEYGDADEVITFSSLDHCLLSMGERWHGSSDRLVSQGIVQDEYADFIAARSG